MGHRFDGLDLPHALPHAPDVLPGFLELAAAGTEVHFGSIGHRQVVGVEPGILDRFTQIVAVHAGEQIGVDHVCGGGIDDALFVGRAGVGFMAHQPARAHVGQVRAHRLGRQYVFAAADRAGQDDNAVVPLPQLAQQCERRKRTGMTAGARTHQNQAVDPCLNRLLRVTHVDHVRQHDAAIGMHRVEHFLRRRAQAGDPHRHLMFDADADVVCEAVVGLVHDLVHRERRHPGCRIGSLESRQFRLDFHQPVAQGRLRPRVERRKTADDAGLALLDDQPRVAGDEQRRTDHGQRKLRQEFLFGHGVRMKTG